MTKREREDRMSSIRMYYCDVCNAPLKESEVFQFHISLSSNILNTSYTKDLCYLHVQDTLGKLQNGFHYFARTTLDTLYDRKEGR